MWPDWEALTSWLSHTASSAATSAHTWALVGRVVDEDPVDAVAVEVEVTHLLPSAGAHVQPDLLPQVLCQGEQLICLRAVKIPARRDTAGESLRDDTLRKVLVLVSSNTYAVASDAVDSGKPAVCPAMVAERPARCEQTAGAISLSSSFMEGSPLRQVLYH